MLELSKIPFNKPLIIGNELDNIRQVVETGRLASDGPFANKCQKWLEDNLSCRQAFLTHSCTAALEISSILCGVEPGDEIIMPSFTFVSSATAFAMRGAIPVFVDIRPDTLNIDEKLVRQAVTEKTKAVLAVHYAGNACAMKELLDISDEHGFFIIEDAAHALLSYGEEGRPLGTIGHLGCLSFHETKGITSGEGGALLINHEPFLERAEMVVEKGTNRRRFFRGEVDKYSWTDIGSSYLPGELTAAFLFAQLTRSEDIMAGRRSTCQRYRQGLQELEKEGLIGLPYVQNKTADSGQIFYILTKSLTERNELTKFMADLAISASFHYVPLHSSTGGARLGRTATKMDVTSDVFDRLLRLPLYYDMADEEIDRVINAITDFYS